jgi:hypothetical protein
MPTKKRVATLVPFCCISLCPYVIIRIHTQHIFFVPMIAQSGEKANDLSKGVEGLLTSGILRPFSGK